MPRFFVLRPEVGAEYGEYEDDDEDADAKGHEKLGLGE